MALQINYVHYLCSSSFRSLRSPLIIVLTSRSVIKGINLPKPKGFPKVGLLLALIPIPYDLIIEFFSEAGVALSQMLLANLSAGAVGISGAVLTLALALPYLKAGKVLLTGTLNFSW